MKSSICQFCTKYYFWPLNFYARPRKSKLSWLLIINDIRCDISQFFYSNSYTFYTKFGIDEMQKNTRDTTFSILIRDNVSNSVTSNSHNFLQIKTNIASKRTFFCLMQKICRKKHLLISWSLRDTPETSIYYMTSKSF